MIVLIFTSALLSLFAILVFSGKGDRLIAGYNSASDQERAKYNIQRVRLIVGLFLMIIAAIVLSGYYVTKQDENQSIMVICLLTGVVVILSIIAIVLVNTWTKKK